MPCPILGEGGAAVTDCFPLAKIKPLRQAGTAGSEATPWTTPHQQIACLQFESRRLERLGTARCVSALEQQTLFWGLLPKILQRMLPGLSNPVPEVMLHSKSVPVGVTAPSRPAPEARQLQQQGTSRPVAVPERQ